MHHRGVVASAEMLADLRQRQVGQFSAQVHRDLAGGDQDPAAGCAAQVFHGHTEVRRGRVHDPSGRDLGVGRIRDEVA